MQRETGQFELVHVIKPFRLIDEESYEKLYWRADGVPLATGYYLVEWPVPGNAGRFDETAEFQGPFPVRQTAEQARLRICGLRPPDCDSDERGANSV